MVAADRAAVAREIFAEPEKAIAAGAASANESAVNDVFMVLL